MRMDACVRFFFDFCIIFRFFFARVQWHFAFRACSVFYMHTCTWSYTCTGTLRGTCASHFIDVYMLTTNYRPTYDNNHDRHNWLTFATAVHRLSSRVIWNAVFQDMSLSLARLGTYVVWQVPMFACVTQKHCSLTNDDIHDTRNRPSTRHQSNDCQAEYYIARYVYGCTCLNSFNCHLIVCVSFYCFGIVLFLRVLFCICVLVNWYLHVHTYIYVHACWQIFMFVYVSICVCTLVNIKRTFMNPCTLVVP